MRSMTLYTCINNVFLLVSGETAKGGREPAGGLRIYVYIYIYIYMCFSLSLCIYIYIYIYTYLFMNLFVQLWTSKLAYIYLYILRALQGRPGAWPREEALVSYNIIYIYIYI